MIARWTCRLIAAIAILLICSDSPVSSAEKPADLKTQTIKVSAPKSLPVSFEMVRLPAGQITLKDKKGIDHTYAVKPIWIAKTELTWDLYDIFWQRLDVKDPWERAKLIDHAQSRPSMPYAPPDQGWGHDGYPAITLTFQSAELFCNWLSAQTGKKFRIPTEAEWEYACRAGGPPLQPDAKRLDELAWFDKNSDDKTHQVAKKKPNAWGLYDTLGNAAEWVVLSDKTNAVAGGSYHDEAADVSSAARETYSRDWQKRDPEIPKSRSWLSDGMHVGLRLVMEDSDDNQPVNPLAPKSK